MSDRFRWWIYSALILSSFSSFTQAQESPASPAMDSFVAATVLPQECLDALVHSAEVLRDSTIEYSSEWEYVVDDPAPRLLREKGCCRLKTGEFHFRKEQTLTDPASPTIVEESAFNGYIFFSGSPAIQKPVIYKLLGDNIKDKSTDVKVVHVPYLDAICYPVPVTVLDWRTCQIESFIVRNLRTGQLHQQFEERGILSLELSVRDPSVVQAKKLDLELLSKANGWTEQSDPMLRYQQVRRREPVRQVRLKLDRSKGFAVVDREEFTPEGNRIASTSCDDFEYFPEERIWLPRVCTVRYFLAQPQWLAGFSETPSMTSRIVRERISFGDQETLQSSLDYGPNTILIERSTIAAQDAAAGEIVYEIQTTAADAIQAGRKHDREFLNLFWLVGKLTLLMLLATIFIVKVRRKTRHGLAVDDFPVDGGSGKNLG